MRGHEPIVAMRKRGQKPAIVYLDLMRDASPMKAWRDWPGVSPAIPTVWVQPEDAPHRLDLRFLVGLTAVVTGEDSDRVAALAKACTDAGALRVVASVVEPAPRREFRVVSVTDSAHPSNDTTTEAAHG